MMDWWLDTAKLYVYEFSGRIVSVVLMAIGFGVGRVFERNYMRKPTRQQLRNMLKWVRLMEKEKQVADSPEADMRTILEDEEPN